MSHHEKKKADKPKPPAAEKPAEDTEGQGWNLHLAVPEEPTEKADENPTGDDTQGHGWGVRL